MTDVEFRIGQGVDIHPFAEGRALILGGIEIPHHAGLAGHSDADVLLHAITDGLLGAVALGDIGAHFPDTDSAWAGADSARLLEAVWGKVSAGGWRLVNLDATVVIEAPKLRPHIDAIRRRVSALLDSSMELCSVKATTSERMGFVGRGEGVLVVCSVLLQRRCRSSEGSPGDR